MIALAELVDPASREVRKKMETEVDEPKRSAYADLAKAKFAVEGTDAYPDATFTLRLSFGTVKGYEENGKHVPFETTFAGLYERSKEHHDAAAVRPAAALGREEGQTGPENAAELRLHGRHHRRQLRQPGRQPRRRAGRHHLRRQHPVAGARLRLQRRAGAGRLRLLAGHHRGPAQGVRRRQAGRRADRPAMTGESHAKTQRRQRMGLRGVKASNPPSYLLCAFASLREISSLHFPPGLQHDLLTGRAFRRTAALRTTSHDSPRKPKDGKSFDRGRARAFPARHADCSGEGPAGEEGRGATNHLELFMRSRWTLLGRPRRIPLT